MNNKFVLDLGGSIICPDEINVSFLREFFSFIKKRIVAGDKFVIVTGGGRVCREFQKAASEVAEVLDGDKDWLGIQATRMNAYLLKAILKDEAHPVIFDERFKIKEFGEYSLIIGCGWAPGNSTDYISVRIAADFGIGKVIVLGKPDYVYTADFNIDKNAKPIEKITWKEYFKLVPDRWTPGFNSPVDPIAAKLAQKEGIKAIIAGGKDLENLEKILDGGEFRGTRIAN